VNVSYKFRFCRWRVVVSNRLIRFYAVCCWIWPQLTPGWLSLSWSRISRLSWNTDFITVFLTFHPWARARSVHILPATPRSSKCSCSLEGFRRKFYTHSHLPHVFYYMSCQSRPSWLDHPNIVWRGSHYEVPLYVFFPASCCFHCPRPEYFCAYHSIITTIHSFFSLAGTVWWFRPNVAEYCAISDKRNGIFLASLLCVHKFHSLSFWGQVILFEIVFLLPGKFRNFHIRPDCPLKFILSSPIQGIWSHQLPQHR
jgi:hypothetical protein